jgi:hypothetical protein
MMVATPQSRPTTYNFWGIRNLQCSPWFGSLGLHEQNAKLLFGWSFKIEYGWRIGSKEEDGKIVEDANFVIKFKNVLRTFLFKFRFTIRVWTKVKLWLAINDVDRSSWHIMWDVKKNGGRRRSINKDHRIRLWCPS